MKIKLVFIFVFNCVIALNAQTNQFNNEWLLCYNYQVPIRLNFSTTAPSIISDPRPINFRSTGSSICDQNGFLRFYTNGIEILDSADNAFANSSGFNAGQFTTAWAQLGLPVFQGVLTLPYPDSAGQYIIIHETRSYDVNILYRPKQLFYSILDMNRNQGLGELTINSDTLLKADIDVAMLTACRHGNGRDWWVLVHKIYTDMFYNYLVTNTGISLVDSQHVGGPITMMGGQVMFSPDGNYYATYDNLSEVRIYDFDRCTGMLSNLRYLDNNDPYIAGGCCFSPDSKRLYINSVGNYYQFDMTNPNITFSKLFIDSIDYFASPFPFLLTDFFWQMLGNDGKIYMSSGSSVDYIHRVNYPNYLGTSCYLEQHALFLNSLNQQTMPNNVNFELGPKLGSVCDSLGLGNVKMPCHNFLFQVFPNPVLSNQLAISYHLPQNTEGTFELHDINGKLIFTYTLPHWSTRQIFDLPAMADGLYMARLYANGFAASQKISISK